VLGALAVVLSIVLLTLGALHLPNVDSHQLTTGSGRLVLMAVLLLLLASCSLIGLTKMKGQAEA
jgi:type VI protein secretion system component VasK